MKLWQKSFSLDKEIERFTSEKDRELDHKLAKWDVLGNLAHIRMLEKINLLTSDERELLHKGLRELLEERINKGDFIIQEGMEDIHSQVEWELTHSLGEPGRKIHSGRSRNDQVLVDLKLYFRDEIFQISEEVFVFFQTLQEKSEKYKDLFMPGYTHMQVAMPSSFGLWFGAYAESLIDDIYLLDAALKTVDQNPLGSAAGYGSSFPLDRKMTTDLLGFENMAINSVNAQMGRGKTEKTLSYAIASIAGTIAKMSMDICLYSGQDFAFFELPDAFTTGSSIMPHKKNPDVFELIRGKCNQLQALPSTVSQISGNLPSGYHRELQIIKEIIFPAIEDIRTVIYMINYATSELKVSENLNNKPEYALINSVDEVNQLVLSGTSFREAYQQVAAKIADGDFEVGEIIKHTHEGSSGNLMNKEIKDKMLKALSPIFEKRERVSTALAELVEFKG